MSVALPHLVVEVLPHNALFLSSATQSLFVSKESGEVLYTMTHGQPLQAPRCSSVQFMQGSKQGEETIECLIALLGDDKELNLYKVSGLKDHNVSVEKVFSSILPKRGVKMVWESTSKGKHTLVVGDRHGDIRSFDIALQKDIEREQSSKRQKVEGENGNEDDLDSTNPPHLGHVSMLTDFILTSFTSSSSQEPALFIITSDRDEHIRISRWGKRRAGHLALRYLLGSTAAIGGICVVEHGLLSTLQQATQTQVGKEICRQPLLISTDSSRLRLWSLHRDAEADGRPDCLFTADLYDVVHQYIQVDQEQERDRQRWHGKGKTDNRKKGEGNEKTASISADTAKIAIDGAKPKRPVVMVKLTAMEANGDVYISFFVDGASALFTFSLSRMISSSAEEAASLVQVLDLGLPVLSQTIEVGNDVEQRSIWMTCDVRHNDEGRESQRGLRRVVWNTESRCWVEDKEGSAVVEKQDHLLSRGTFENANSLLLYDALTLYPKQEFELAASVQDAIGPNGLVRGGLSNFESLGRYKGDSTPNKMNHQRAAGKKVKAREVMMKRIEQTLEANTESINKAST